MLMATSTWSTAYGMLYGTLRLCLTCGDDKQEVDGRDAKTAPWASSRGGTRAMMLDAHCSRGSRPRRESSRSPRSGAWRSSMPGTHGGGSSMSRCVCASPTLPLPPALGALCLETGASTVTHPWLGAHVLTRRRVVGCRPRCPPPPPHPPSQSFTSPPPSPPLSLHPHLLLSHHAQAWRAGLVPDRPAPDPHTEANAHPSTRTSSPLPACNSDTDTDTATATARPTYPTLLTTPKSLSPVASLRVHFSDVCARLFADDTSLAQHRLFVISLGQAPSSTHPAISVSMLAAPIL